METPGREPDSHFNANTDAEAETKDLGRIPNNSLSYWLHSHSYQHQIPRFSAILDDVLPNHDQYQDVRNRFYSNMVWPTHYPYEAFRDLDDIVIQYRYRRISDDRRLPPDPTVSEKTKIVQSLVETKQAEQAWIEHFGSPETKPQAIVGSLEEFWGWLGKARDWYATDSWQVGDTKFITPSSFRNIVFESTVRAIKAEPDLEEKAVNAWVHLTELAAKQKQDVNARIYHSVAKLFDNYLYYASLDNDSYIPSTDREVYLGFLAQLTDRGVIPPSHWYKYAVDYKGRLPNFEFLDFLRAMLIEKETEVRGSREHNAAYADALVFIDRALDRLAEIPERNQAYAAAIKSKLVDLRRDGRNSPADFIAVSNLLVPIINSQSGEAPLHKLDTVKTGNLPLAFWRLLYATRGHGQPEPIQADQAYEDEVYSDIFSFTFSRATKSHQAWFTKQLAQDTGDRALYNRGRRYGTTYRTGVHRWRKGRPIYAKLIS